MNSLKRISIEGFILLTIGVVLVTRACILKFPDTTIENRIFIIGCSFLGPGLGSTYKNIKFIRNPYNYEKYIKKRDFEKDVYIKD